MTSHIVRGGDQSRPADGSVNLSAGRAEFNFPNGIYPARKRGYSQLLPSARWLALHGNIKINAESFARVRILEQWQRQRGGKLPKLMATAHHLESKTRPFGRCVCAREAQRGLSANGGIRAKWEQTWRNSLAAASNIKRPWKRVAVKTSHVMKGTALFSAAAC